MRGGRGVREAGGQAGGTATDSGDRPSHHGVTFLGSIAVKCLGLLALWELNPAYDPVTALMLHVGKKRPS